jgi:hypothetical protein
MSLVCYNDTLFFFFFLRFIICKGNADTLNSETCWLSKADVKNTRFVQKVSGLELQWFTGWDAFATSLDIFVHVSATHDTSWKRLRLLSWL